MRRDRVTSLYDAAYATSYDAKFLTSPPTAADTAHELELVRSLLPATGEWLDVACGTGYFLERFPEARRVGSDLSPAMLAEARGRNPGVPLVEHDFREPNPGWDGRFDLVSCMWYAYTLVDTMDEACAVFANLAAWTSPAGTCFLPLADPRMISRCDLPYHLEDGFPGSTTITGILWSFVEDDGRKVHAHLVTPQVELVVEQFAGRFEQVDVVRYPAPDGRPGRPALVATRKRPEG